MKPVYVTAREVCRLAGFSDATLRRYWTGDPDFPKPIRLTPGPSGRLRWVEGEVLAWLESRRETTPA